MSEENKNTTAAEAEDTKQQYFDKQEAYSQEVVPLMKQLSEVCEKHGLPHMVWIIFQNSKGRSGQGLIYQNHRDGDDFVKMTVLANIADGNLRTEHLASAALAFKMASMFAKSETEKKEEVSK